MNLKPVIIISGPTATGKTHLAIKIAQYFPNMTVVNFDSLLFYRELNIGTAKPTTIERGFVPHELIDVASVLNPLNAQDFIKLAESKINELHAKSHIPILVGGSAFYLRSLLKGMYSEEENFQAIDNKIDNEILHKLMAGDIPYLIEYLKQHDPESLIRVHHNDKYRLERAALYHIKNQKTITSSILEKQNEVGDFYDFSTNIHHYNLLHLYLNIPRERHFPIILARTKKMIADGLIEEVQNLLKNNIDQRYRPLKSIGYQETFAYLNGEIKTIDDLIERIAISTRQLAKSQRTFFNKIHPKYEFEYNSEDIFPLLAKFLMLKSNNIKEK